MKRGANTSADELAEQRDKPGETGAISTAVASFEIDAPTRECSGMDPIEKARRELEEAEAAMHAAVDERRRIFDAFGQANKQVAAATEAWLNARARHRQAEIDYAQAVHEAPQ